MDSNQTKFGKYHLLRRIASGGMAEIYLARQEGMAGFAREVVIKRIHEHLNNDPEFVSMFLDEARLVAKLSHPNIVSVHEFGKEEGAHYLVMEYVDGEAVSAAIKRSHGLEPVHAFRIIAEVCAGLDYAHSLADEEGNSLHIVHRDVSPQNVLLGYDGAVKIIDFGVAKASTQSHETQVGSFKGKYAYMSPEQARGKSADRRSDVHSVGIVLWEMLTGKSLFHRESVFHTMEAVVSMDPPSVHEKHPELSPRIDDIIAKAIAKSPDERYQNCGDLQVDIEEYAAEQGLLSSSLALSRYVRTLFRRESHPPPEEIIEELDLLPEEESAPLDSDSDLSPMPDLGVSDALESLSAEPEPPQRSAEPEPPQRSASLPPPPPPETPASESSAFSLADEWDELSETQTWDTPPDEGRLSVSERPDAEPSEADAVSPTEPALTMVDDGRRRRTLAFLTTVVVGVAAIGLGVYWVLSSGGVTGAEADAGGPRRAAIPVFAPRDAGPSRVDATPAGGSVDGGLDFVMDDEAGPMMEGLLTAFLSIYSDPAGAAVWIDGRETGERTAVRDLPMDPGGHTVKLVLHGYRLWQAEVNVERGGTRALSATLIEVGGDEEEEREEEPEPEDYGLLSVNTVPAARVFEGRRELGRTPLSGLELPAGTYRLSFLTEDGEVFERTVSIRSGRGTRRRFELIPPEDETSGRADAGDVAVPSSPPPDSGE